VTVPHDIIPVSAPMYAAPAPSLYFAKMPTALGTTTTSDSSVPACALRLMVAGPKGAPSGTTAHILLFCTSSMCSGTTAPDPTRTRNSRRVEGDPFVSRPETTLIMVPGAKYVAGEVEAAAFPTQSR